MKAIVTDYRTLKAMERRGFIVTRDGRERHWTGVMVRNYFVSPGPRLINGHRFTYKGVEYSVKYLDGCFHPFVVRLDVPAPAFV